MFDSLRQKTTDLHLNEFRGISADKYYLDADSFTYVSDCHNTAAWIDHVTVNEMILSRLKKLLRSVGCYCI